MKSFVILIAILLAFNVSRAQNSTSEEASGKPEYACPMKCEGEKTYSDPGKCPVCKMSLAAVKPKTRERTNLSEARVAGRMSDVMMGNDVTPHINLDTMANKKHLYGMGPGEKMWGEIMILNGTLFLSTPGEGNSMNVTTSATAVVKPPFFGYQTVARWSERPLPDSVVTMRQLDLYLNTISPKQARPFFFKITGVIDSASIHVVNLSLDTRNLPQGFDMHKQQQSYPVEKTAVEILGFYSTKHAGIFTHKGSFTHLHLLTNDRKRMGHVDKLYLARGKARLSLPLD